MKSKSFNVLSLIIILYICPLAYGSNNELVFLKIDASAESVGTARATASISRGIVGLTENPAGIRMTSKPELAVGYVHWIENAFQFTGSIVGKLNAKANFGAAISYFSARSSDGSAITMNAGIPTLQSTGDINASDILITCGAATQITSSLLFGMSLRYVYEKIERNALSACNCDAGIAYAFKDKLKTRCGAVVKYIPLGAATSTPLVAEGGFSMTFDSLRLGTDIGYDNGIENIYAQFGAQAQIIRDTLFIRGGYMLIPSTSGKLCGGIGISVKQFQCDIAAEQYGSLGYLYRFTLKYNFAGRNS